MWTQAGFKVECQSNDDAAKVAEQMKAFLKTKELSNDNWEKGICVKGDTVELADDAYTVWDDWDGLFEQMCESVEKKLPGLMLCGKSSFSESTGGLYTKSFEQTDDGIIFAKRMEDYDAIMQMVEAGLEPEQIAEETGMSVEEIEEFMDFDEDEQEEEYV